MISFLFFPTGGLDPQCKNCSATDFPIVNKCEGSQLMQCSTQPPQNPFSQALISTAFDTSEGCTGTVIGYGFTKLNVCPYTPPSPFPHTAIILLLTPLQLAYFILLFFYFLFFSYLLCFLSAELCCLRWKVLLR